MLSYLKSLWLTFGSSARELRGLSSGGWGCLKLLLLPMPVVNPLRTRGAIRRWPLALSGAFMALGFAAAALSNPHGSPVWLVKIKGTIDPATSDYLEGSIKLAAKSNADLVLVELDTPGGLVSSVREMAQAIDQSTVPVAVYVTPAGASATSAGALLSLASHVALMAPGTHIGAAHPVGPEGKDIPGKMGEKAENDTAAFARGLAELRGRNRELAEQVVTKSRSLTAQEAVGQKLVEIIAANRDEALQKLDGREITVGSGKDAVKKTLKTAGASVYQAEMSLGQKILHTIANPNIATLLMTLGVLCLYIEITTPGITIAGVLGGIALVTGMIAFQMLPIRAGGFLLLLAGVVMLLVEPFVVSHGALAAGGTLGFILGILWMFDPNVTSLTVSRAIWIPAAIVLGGGALLIGVMAARLHRLVQKTLAQVGGGAAFGLSGYVGRVESVTTDGLGGKALFRGETWDIRSETPLERGAKVEVLKVEGMRATVKRISDG